MNFAASHFAISFIIGLVCLFYFYGAGLSDVYHPDPPWITALVAALWVLQLPVAAFETITLHPSTAQMSSCFVCWGFCGALLSVTLSPGLSASSTGTVVPEGVESFLLTSVTPFAETVRFVFP
ncbi:MAG: hypothetical protein WCQ21_04810 [Verrucomicrobiota bacterium]